MKIRINLSSEEDAVLRELMRNSLDNLGDWGHGAAKAQAFHFIRAGAPWTCNEGDDASILGHAALLKWK